MMNLWELLKVSKGLPPPDLETFLTAEKIGSKNSGSSTTTSIANGYPCVLENSVGLPAAGYKIYGNSIQDGEPSPESPVEIQSVGELVTEGEHKGKYKITVVTSGKNLLDIERLKESTESWITPAYKLSLKLKPNAEYTLSSNVPYAVGNQPLYFNGATHSTHGVYKDRPRTAVSSDDGTIFVAVCKGRQYADDILSGKYYILLEAGSKSTAYEPYHEPAATSIYLAKPLKTGDILKYPENVLEHPDGTIESVSLPKIPTFSGTAIVSTDTEVEPSDMEITYKSGGKNYD